tara:strand:- start:578 stop:760 length:183 start_codon:yes stop_codon:yes gene_type:complete
MDNTVRKSIGALMLLIAVYFGYQRALSSELRGGMWGLGLIVFGGGGAYLITDKPKPNDNE